MDTHRVRRLRWRARASSPAEAFALRSLLREHGDACQAALERAFDGAAPPHSVWHLPRLELKIRLADVQHLEPGALAERVEAALRTALAEARQAGRRDADTIERAPASAAPWAFAAAASSHRSTLAEGRQALQHYLRTGLLPWTLAGLAIEQAQRSLSEAAVLAAQAVLSGAVALDALLPQTGTDARIGALLRWLPLLPAALRRQWLAAYPAGPSPDAGAIDAWRAWIDDDAADRIAWQALWLAGPLDLAGLRPRLVAQGAANAASPPFLPALSAAVEAAAHAPARIIGTTPDAVRAGTRTAATPAAEVDASPAISSLLVPLAGLVLLHPWLPRLLAACGVLDDGGRQIAPGLLPRACALLHALACGSAEAAEHQLPFIKLLLGHPPDEPLTAALPMLAPSDHDEIAALLAAVSAHWSALRGTGIDGLRLSFLQRRGLLTRGDGAWQVRIESEPFDLLLGLLPWSIDLVRLPWMPLPLAVEWPTP